VSKLTNDEKYVITLAIEIDVVAYYREQRILNLNICFVAVAID
jgi:hypothetical protein